MNSSRKWPPFSLLIKAWLLVGTLDLLAAFIDLYVSLGRNPFQTVPRYIASAWFGMDAFKGGGSMIAWGVLFHYLIAGFFTLFFFLLYVNIRWMSRYWVLAACLFSLFIWVVMNRLVVPASRVPVLPVFNPWKALKAVAILTFLIGLPLAWIAKRHYEKYPGTIRKSTGL